MMKASYLPSEAGFAFGSGIFRESAMVNMPSG